MKRYLVITLILLFFGCKKREIPFIENFNDKGNAVFTEIDNIPELVLYYPIRLLKIQNSFIISDYKGEKVFTVVNESGKSFQFGNRGRGPNEFIDGYGLALLTDTSFVIFDRMLKMVSFFEVKNDTVFCYNRKTKIPAINNVFPYNDSIFVTNGSVPFAKNYGVLDLSKNVAYSYIDYPKISKGKLSEQAKQRAYYSHIVRKPNSNRFVAFKASHYIIDVMDLEGTKLKLRERKIFAHNKWEMSKNIPVPGVRGTLNRITAKIAGSDSAIFVCYKIQENNRSQWCILTFDWGGNPKNRYNIPFVPYAIASGDNSTLYCITLMGEKYELVKIDISEKNKSL
ncbi:MAG: BF3164 family lipoprotein [Mangrovibacterium sp.]